MKGTPLLSNPLVRKQIAKAQADGQTDKLISLLSAWLSKPTPKATSKPEVAGADSASVDRALIAGLVRALELADTQEKRDEVLKEMLDCGKRASGAHASREKHHSWREWGRLAVDAVGGIASVAAVGVMIIRLRKGA